MRYRGVARIVLRRNSRGVFDSLSETQPLYWMLLPGGSDAPLYICRSPHTLRREGARVPPHTPQQPSAHRAVSASATIAEEEVVATIVPDRQSSSSAIGNFNDDRFDQRDIESRR